MGKKRDVLNILSKKYSHVMLKSLEKGPKRFKDLSSSCEGEKMRAQRLKEFEDLKLLDVKVKRIGRRAVSVYRLSGIGKETLKLSEDIRKLQEKKQSD
jgi:DNA-binding HxlR family transcriptional regulator